MNRVLKTRQVLMEAAALFLLRGGMRQSILISSCLDGSNTLLMLIYFHRVT